MSFLDENINKIINADCLDILKKLPDKCIDLVLTDPPYGIGNKFTSEYGLQERKSSRGSFTWNDKIPDKEVFDEIFRVSKNQIIFGGNYFTEYMKPTKAWLVWDKIGNYNLKNPFSDCDWRGQVSTALSENIPLSIWALFRERVKKANAFIRPRNRLISFKKFYKIFQKRMTLSLTVFQGQEQRRWRVIILTGGLFALKKILTTGLSQSSVWRKSNSRFLFLII